MLQLGSDSRCPASPVSAAGLGPPHPSLPLGAAPAKPWTPGRWMGLPDIPFLLQRLHRAGCSPPEPCPLWKQSPSLGPSAGSDHPHRGFFSPSRSGGSFLCSHLCCCLNSSETSLMLFQKRPNTALPLSSSALCSRPWTIWMATCVSQCLSGVGEPKTGPGTLGCPGGAEQREIIDSFNLLATVLEIQPSLQLFLNCR